MELLATFPHYKMQRKEFIFFLASLLAITAFAIDIIMPAFNDISSYFGLSEENQRQAIVAYYLMGLGVAQIFFGPLSDHYGRKSVLQFSLVMYVVLAISSTLVESYSSFLFCRFVMGLSSGGPSVIAVALIRDRYKGREMAQTTSLALSIFIAVPIIAPLLGQVLLAFIDWQGLFYILAVYCCMVIVWAWLRLDETAPLSATPPGIPSAKRLTSALADVEILVKDSYRRYRTVITNKVSVLLLAASGLLVGLMFSYLNVAQQIFVNTYHTGVMFPLYFAIVASAIVFSSLINAKIVIRLGTVRVIERAIIAMTALCLLWLAVTYYHEPSLYEFLVAQFLIIFALGFLRPNLTARALEPHGNHAGTASAFSGFMVNFGGAIVGYLISQQYDGSNASLAGGNIVVVVLALAILHYHRTFSKRVALRSGVSRHTH